jgi:hypothetical protein
MASIMGVAPALQQAKSALLLSPDSSVVVLKDNAEELSFMASASMLLPPPIKAELINRLASAGMSNIEAGSFVSPK